MRQVLCSQLIGREEEMEALSDALAAAWAGHGSAVMLVGEAGVGKTRLSHEIETLALRQGRKTLRGRAMDGSIGGYRPIAEALLSALRATPVGDAAEVKPIRSILSRLIPEWRQEGARVDPPPQSGSAGDFSFVLGDAVLRLLCALGGDHGCLLILEDLHWADADTLAVVEYLADNLHAERILLLGTIRSDEPGVDHNAGGSSALRQARAMAARRAIRILTLPRLDDDNVNDMARVCLGMPACPEPVVDLLTSYADGLPFLIEELLAAWIGAGALVQTQRGWEIAGELSPIAPVTLSDTVNRRLSALGTETRRVLEAAAILGRSFDWTLLPEATGLDEQDTLDRLRHAIDAQLIMVERPSVGSAHERAAPPSGSPSQATFAFRHALTRSAVLAQLLPPERTMRSARMLALVEAAHPNLPGAWSDLAASLAEAAGETSHAARLLLESGRRALARGALATAETTLDRARTLHPDDQALSIAIEHASLDALSLAGKWERVFDVGERLLAALDQSIASSNRRAEVHLCIARAAIAAGRWDEAAAQLDRARHAGGSAPGGPAGPAVDLDDLPAPRDDFLARLDALAAHLAIEQSRLDEASAFAKAALDRAERAGLSEVACEALEVLGRCARAQDLEQAEAAFSRAHAIANENGLTVWRIRALHELGTIDLFRFGGRRIERLVEARHLAVNVGALATVAMIDVQIAACHDEQAEPDTTLEVARRAETMARRLRLDLTAAVALLFQGCAHAKLGNRVEMEEALDEALRLGGTVPDILGCIWESRAFASLVEERRRQALHDLEMAMAAVRDLQTATPGPYHGVWALIRTLEGLDARGACDLVGCSGVTINPINRGYVGYAEAIILGRSGLREEAMDVVARADADLAGIDWYRHLGRRLMAEAAIADAWGDPVTWLWEACACFEANKQEKPASACRSLLRRAGVPASHTSRRHANVPATFRSLGITGREMEVLVILAEGLSNKEIGERLYLSPRTVEKHIASLMAKTATRTRAQLATLAVSTTG